MQKAFKIQDSNKENRGICRHKLSWFGPKYKKSPSNQAIILFYVSWTEGFQRALGFY